ncbi:MAG TPA: glycosyltransferase family 4 protein [Nitrospirota bacterium]|jgi:glycosyltransferase involved in cell wall biosynthesis
MKKLTILHTEASDGWGGQEIRIIAEMLGMRGRGHRVLLACPAHATICRRAKEAGIEVFEVGMGKAGMFVGTLKLARIIKDAGVDIVNTHSSRDSWMGSAAGRLTGRKVIRSRHISSEIKTDPGTRLVYGPLCDAIITTGESIKAMLIDGLGLPAEKIVSIPTGIKLDSFDGSGREKVRREFGIPDSSPVIGIAATLRSWKGHIYILNAMAGILKAYPDARLMIVGEGPFRDRNIEPELRRLSLGDAVIMAGHRDDIPEVIAAFDIAVMASYASEGIPQFALQAMATGLPLIGTTVGGIPEVLQDGVTGLLIPPKDSMAISGAVLKMLSDPAMMRAMGEAARAAAARKHSYEKMLDDVEALYGRLAG